MIKFAQLIEIANECDQQGRYEEADMHVFLLRLAQNLTSRLQEEGVETPFSGVLNESNSAWRMNSGMSPLLNQSFQGNGPEEAMQGYHLNGNETPEQIWQKQQEWAQQAYGQHGWGQIGAQQQEMNIQLYARQVYEMYIHQGYPPAQAKSAADQYVAQARMSLQNPAMGMNSNPNPSSAFSPTPYLDMSNGLQPTMPPTNGTSPSGSASTGTNSSIFN